MKSELQLAIREDFPALKNRRNAKPPIYFDNACTTLVPQQVIVALTDYYTQYPACGGGRSRHWFAEEVTARIEGDTEKGMKGSRSIIQEFINARSENEIIFTLNTSHAINLVALGLKFQPDDVVLLTDTEHNSNLVPWLRLQKQGLIKVEPVISSSDGTFNLESYRNMFRNNRVRLVSMGYTSNLTGYTIPAQEIVKIAHEHGALVLLDGAQTVAHRVVDVQALDVDLLAFSIHKMCGPKGVGVLYGKQELLGLVSKEDGNCAFIEPVILGGGTVTDSTYDSYRLARAPACFEAGIQNYAGQIAAGAAIQYLQHIGMEDINAHEIQLNIFLTKQLTSRYGKAGWFRVLGPQAATARGGVLTFEVKRPNSIGIAQELSNRSNIMIRDGAFCVHSYLNREFGQGWAGPKLPHEHRMTYRVSLYFYNTKEECQIFLDTLHTIFEERGYV